MSSDAHLIEKKQATLISLSIDRLHLEIIVSYRIQETRMNDLEEVSTSTGLQRRILERRMSSTACTIFNELRLEGKLCDVVLKVDDVEFNAHKNILCGCSEYFR